MFKPILFCLLFFSLKTVAQYNGNQSGMLVSTTSGLLNHATVFTIEFWVKTVDNRRNDVYWQRPTLFGNVTSGENSGDFGITLNSGYVGMWEGVSNLNGDQQFLSNSVRINDGFYHHIAAVNNGQTINLYVDGNIIGSLVSGRNLVTSSAPLTFGAASLDYNFPGNLNGNKNFIANASFREARISASVRYLANFIPSESLSSDASTVALYHFDRSNYSSQPVNPNQPVIFDPSEPINNNAAQPATLILPDSTLLYGKLLLGKRNWSLSNSIYIHFFEGNSHKVKYYKPEEVKGFQMGDSYYEPKFLAGGGAIRTSLRKTIVKRLTPAGSKMALYVNENHYHTNDNKSSLENKDLLVYFVQLPDTHDDKIYQFTDNKFTPKFDVKVSAMVPGKPLLADKIRSKDKDYFYSQITEEKHQLRVWWNIVNEYNKP